MSTNWKAEGFKMIIELTKEELREIPWWKFKRTQHLRKRLRWAQHHYKIQTEQKQERRNEWKD